MHRDRRPDNQRKSWPTARSGFTLLELLLVMALVAIGAGAIGGSLRPSAEARAASALRALIVGARHEALLRGASVAVMQVPGRFESRVQTGIGATCVAGGLVAELDLAAYAGVRVAAGWASGGLVWLPTGSGRTCAGGGVISSTVVLEGWRGSASVVVSSLGRVRVERN